MPHGPSPAERVRNDRWLLRPEDGGGRERHPGRSSRDDARWKRLAAASHLLDSRFRVPGTSWRYGVDGLIGLIPGVGDTATAAISGWIIWEGYRLGARKRTLARMIGNALIDTVIGAVPLVGDLFDFAYKANRRNIGLLGADLGRPVHLADRG